MSQTPTRTRKGPASSRAKVTTPPVGDILALPAYRSDQVPDVFFETANSQALAYGLGLTFWEIRPDCVDTVRRHVNCTGNYRSCRSWKHRSNLEKLAAIGHAIRARPSTTAERTLFVATSLAGCLAEPELLVEWLGLSFHEALEVTRGVRHDSRHWHLEVWCDWEFNFNWNAHRFGFPEGVTDWGAA